MAQSRGTTVDLGGNTNAASTEVLSGMVDWAIDDAGRSILYYGIGVLIALIAVIGLTVVLVGRKRKDSRIWKQSESVSEWIDEIVEKQHLLSQNYLLNLYRKRNYALRQEGKRGQIGKIEFQMMIFLAR